MPALRGRSSRSGLSVGLLDEEDAAPSVEPGSAALHAEASPELQPAPEPESSTLHITTPVGGHSVSGTDSMRLSEADVEPDDADDETEIEMFAGVKCCSGFAFSFALITLCVVDLLHVALTILFCSSVRTMVYGPNPQLHAENQWLSTASTACIGLYGVKIASQVGILIQRWLQIRSLPKARSEKWDATRCWREEQEWFISMTFNSFLMVFVMLMIEQPYEMQRLATLRFKLKI